MWLGILTPGVHDCRPDATPGLATLYCWNDIARMRIDGPADDLPGGVRMLRRSLADRDQAPHDPRCFVCGAVYDMPDPIAARADAVDARDVTGLVDDALAAVPADAVIDADDAGALFVLVHVDDEPAGRDEEALVVVPEQRLAALVPLEALSPFVGLLQRALAGAEPTRCSFCTAIAPANARSSGAARVSRAQRRAQARAAGRTRRRAA